MKTYAAFDMDDVSIAQRLIFVFAELKLKHCCTVSMTFDREGYTDTLVGK